MKKVIAVLMALLLIGGVFAGCSAEGNGENATDTTTAEKSQKYDVQVLGSEIGSDFEGKPILIVEYAFTNNSDEATSFTVGLTDKAYQNGVENSDIVIADGIDSQQQLNDVKPGSTYQLKVGYLLQDTETPVEIEISELFSSKPFFTQTIELK